MTTEQITITGIIEIITYKNEDNGFFVCKVRVKGQKQLVAITGKTPVNLSVGEVISAMGTWQNTKYGTQLNANDVQLMLPKSLVGIQKYLASGAIKGVGEGFAKHIVTKFGEKALDIIENNPEELTKIKGISAAKAEKISKSWQDGLKVREMMLFLQSHDVTVNFAAKIYKHYGDAAINILREDPYRMARDIKGVGFLSADKIAMNLGMQSNDKKRISAGIEHVLLTATTQGSCALPFNLLVEKAQEFLSVEKDMIEDVTQNLILSGRLVAMRDETFRCVSIKATDNIGTTIFSHEPAKSDLEPAFGMDEFRYINPLVFFTPFFHIERNIAEKLAHIYRTGKSIFSEITLEKALEELKEQHGIILADLQREAIEMLQYSKILVVTGGPGTGKTTLIRAILKISKILQQKLGYLKIKLAAPTGRAAKRISESSGAFASTIHRMLEFDPAQGGFKHNENNYLKCDLLVLDEASMIDVQLMNAILKALSQMTTVIIVGDVDQLPSIGAGQILSDIINSSVVPTVRLNKVFRQASHSRIITNAHMVNSGKIPYLGAKDDEEQKTQSRKSDFEFISADDDIATIAQLKQVITSQDVDVMKNVQILTPMQRGSLGVRAINPILQNILNDNRGSYIDHFGSRYYVGDKVIQTENNYNKNVFNGDIGFISQIDREEGEVIINFDGNDIIYELSEFDQISLAYAITIHKSQGSEYHTVIMPILTQHFIMLNKNLLYTGITRAKKKLIMIGQKKAIAMAVKSNRVERRYSMLQAWLIEKFGKL